MNFFKRTPSANTPDKILDEQERFLTGPVFLPISESKYFRTENDACANGPAQSFRRNPRRLTLTKSRQQSKLIQTYPSSNIS